MDRTDSRDNSCLQMKKMKPKYCSFHVFYLLLGLRGLINMDMSLIF